MHDVAQARAAILAHPAWPGINAALDGLFVPDPDRGGPTLQQWVDRSLAQLRPTLDPALDDDALAYCLHDAALGRAAEQRTPLPGYAPDCDHPSCHASATPSQVWRVRTPAHRLLLGHVQAAYVDQAWAQARAMRPDLDTFHLERLDCTEADVARATHPQGRAGRAPSRPTRTRRLDYAGLTMHVPAWRAWAGAPLRCTADAMLALAVATDNDRIGSCALALHRIALRVTTGPVQW